MKNAAQSGEPKPIVGWVLALLSLAVGLVAGFGAVVFRDLIGVFHNLLFLGRFSFYYDANIHTAQSGSERSRYCRRTLWVRFIHKKGSINCYERECVLGS